MKKLLNLLILCLLTFYSYAQTPKLLLRLDDNGMNHSVNTAIKEVAETGIPFSTSVMFACPWYQETVEILKKYPMISVGVHLTLNAEWKYYRWGPVAGRSAVPSLVDSNGYFYSSTAQFLASKYALKDVEKELSAQIERALRSGLKIDYVDFHMGTALATPELRATVEKLAKKYGLGISHYMGEQYKTMFEIPVDKKKDALFQHLKELNPSKVNLMVFHVAKRDPEMEALIDMNSPDMQAVNNEPIVAIHRTTELSLLLSKEFQDLIKSGNVQLITYKDLIKSIGLANMKSPF
ncbi:ChbG/HpnK family deacetylase [Solitalea sp. MAHUQ-68]|uniref:ChbG/HpnK family deacetylase n=1 Tax=Solitalea agri TaxID=2953739 RepID=A0A9X2F2W5_9SPHI|nr:ChbG/HpnK family deacetylase [Solitalea agri]MCO4293179.1 ChbG/HpnK family deacetylase [Solitalea agri]